MPGCAMETEELMTKRRAAQLLRLEARRHAEIAKLSDMRSSHLELARAMRMAETAILRVRRTGTGGRTRENGD